MKHLQRRFLFKFDSPVGFYFTQSQLLMANFNANAISRMGKVRVGKKKALGKPTMASQLSLPSLIKGELQFNCVPSNLAQEQRPNKVTAPFPGQEMDAS